MKRPTSKDDLAEIQAECGVTLPQSDNISVLSSPVSLGRLRSPNRFVALPMEGCDAGNDGSPAALTYRRYERMVAGGAGVIWVEACSVTPAGRSNPNALLLTEQNVTAHREFLSHLRRVARDAMGHSILCILQLTHSGRYCRPDGKLQPFVVRRCPELDAIEKGPAETPLASDEQIEQVQQAFLRAAALAHQAGYDGVDVKACHGYLVSSLLGARQRPGRYGGDYENRTRFLKETLSGIQDRTPELLVTTRVNLFDGVAYPNGFGVSTDRADRADLTEPLKLIGELAEMGVGLLGVSIGFPRFDPHFGRPSSDGRYEHPLVGIGRFCDLAARAQHAAPQLPVVNAALAWLSGALPHVAAGLIERGDVQLIGLGRNSLAYPDSARDMLTGTFDPEKSCIACSGCSTLLRRKRAVGCVIRDRSVYRLE